ncbi:F0F1 ATP synthase subunit delta [Georgenia deserti]|uniref:ATP synthase subunit delta n=1 Tax=Georgenia deserti TaxID=2093781 RepID=A0ABW4L082_9MICO
MRATSSSALARAQERWEPVLREAGESGRAYGEQLFAVVDLLDGEHALLRALTEPAHAPEDRARLAERVLGGKVDDAVADLVGGLVRDRWSAADDLLEASEFLGVISVLAAAEHAGRLEDVEDELYRLSRILEAERELLLALSARERTEDERARLVTTLLEGKVGPESLVLAVRAATTPRSHDVAHLLHAMTEQAAGRRQRLVASVTSAVPLTEQQRSRLARILSRQHGREVEVHVDLDPDVVGGMRVQVQDSVVDATLASRLADARRRLAG